MKKVSIVSLIALMAIVISSCGSSNNVVSNHGISKRKYNKGFFFKRKSNLKTADAKVKEADVKEDQSIAKVEKVEARKAKKARKAEKLNARENTIASTDLAPESSNEPVQSTVSEPLEETSQESGFVSDDLNDEEWSVSENSSAETTDMTEETSKENKDQAAKKKKKSSSQRGDIVFILAVIFAILIPPLGVAIYTNIDWMKVLIAFLLTLLAVVPGIVYALLVVFDVI